MGDQIYDLDVQIYGLVHQIIEIAPIYKYITPMEYYTTIKATKVLLIFDDQLKYEVGMVSFAKLKFEMKR